MTRTEELIAIDIRNATLGPKRARSRASAEELCRFTALEPDARQSELLAIDNPDLSLAGIRSHLLRGNLDEARSKLEALVGSTDEILRSEALYEQARLLAFDGNWEGCLLQCNEALKSKPAAITRLSVLQTRSIALFELGGLTQSLNDVEMVLSQAPLFPHAVAVNFSKVQLAKLQARLQSPELGRVQAAQLWDELLSSPPLNLDNLLILLRLEIDLLRLEKKPTSAPALASYLVASVLGDRLYEGLAVLDLVRSYTNPPEFLLQALRGYEAEFPRVRNAGQAPLTGAPENACSLEPQDLLTGSVRKILVPRYRCIVDLRERTARMLSPNLGWLGAISEIGPRGKHRGDVFTAVWGLRRYSKQLHDGTLRTFLHRVRKQHGLNISSRDQKLYLDETLSVST